MARCCTLGNLEVTQRHQDQWQEQHLSKAHQLQLLGRTSKQDPQGPTQLGPEGLSHRPPLSLIALTLLVNRLHNQVHDVDQDPGDKTTERDGGSWEQPWLPPIPANMMKSKPVHKG